MYDRHSIQLSRSVAKNHIFLLFPIGNSEAIGTQCFYKIQTKSIHFMVQNPKLQKKGGNFLNEENASLKR